MDFVPGTPEEEVIGRKVSLEEFRYPSCDSLFAIRASGPSYELYLVRDKYPKTFLRDKTAIKITV